MILLTIKRFALNRGSRVIRTNDMMQTFIVSVILYILLIVGYQFD